MIITQTSLPKVIWQRVASWWAARVKPLDRFWRVIRQKCVFLGELHLGLEQFYGVKSWKNRLKLARRHYPAKMP